MEQNEEKNINISPVPKFVDIALTNIADAPTKQMGSTFSDIWFLVFGGIGHLAEKRKMKYAFALKRYENDLSKKIDNIPTENRIEADTQIIAPALEASKYCIEKDELREMFSNLIASSMNSEKEAMVHPIFTDIIKRLSFVDAQLLKTISSGELTGDKVPSDDHIIFSVTIERLSFSIAVLKNLGLIEYRDTDHLISEDFIKNKVANYKFNSNRYIKCFNNFNNILVNDSVFNITYDSIFKLLTEYMKKRDFAGNKFPAHKTIVEYFGNAIQLTPLGQRFKLICLDS